jgi:hypothetical protein
MAADRMVKENEMTLGNKLLARCRRDSRQT